jgi:ribosomal protein L9
MNVGEVGEVVTVKRGYARNYLFPRGLAGTVQRERRSRSDYLAALEETNATVGEGASDAVAAEGAAASASSEVPASGLSTTVTWQRLTRWTRRHVVVIRRALVPASVESAADPTVTRDLLATWLTSVRAMKGNLSEDEMFAAVPAVTFIKGEYTLHAPVSAETVAKALEQQSGLSVAPSAIEYAAETDGSRVGLAMATLTSVDDPSEQLSLRVVVLPR